MTTKQQEMHLLWVLGSIQKLSELGVIQNPPLTLYEQSWNMYHDVDENRDLIPDIAVEVIIKFGIEAGDFNAVDPQNIIDILCEYKNNRIEFVKKALNILYSKSSG